ncbi:8-amino-7-oxononanoate synthase [Trichlorobacter ammonificans]|uniref:8-amino-7-oxononanoate synthase n=1 Tax=Trichlorobacter ammonificans TaxID=2916410 RepID=A0ABM9D7T4_9BACT|nr:8-amino-7-oxononanoate synthase [Trichlorobacter ammonificans]CAH2030798.1 8-amino-7-oxononanoate synthase [Trichlorobacter ammonificans]
MTPEAIIRQRTEDLVERGLFRSIRSIAGTGPLVELDGRQVLLLCSNNYLGLAEHSALKRAAATAAEQAGASSGASRLVSGSTSLHDRLEAAVADWKGTEAALLFNSGYAANTGIIAALAGRGDTVFSDRLNHASIIDGVLLSGARLVRYPHNDVDALERLLTRQTGSGLRLIVTDGVFSMDGDLAPLRQLAECARRHNALLMVDDAHGGGVLGQEGRGSCNLLGVAEEVQLLMGTFGKALGSFGAYVATSRLLRDYLVNRARSLVFSTSLPPAVPAASLAAVHLVRSAEGANLRQRLADNTALFRALLRDEGFTVPDDPTPIVPLVVGDPLTTMTFSARLLERNILVQGIRPPTVPQGTSRLRCTVMATHEQEDLRRAAAEIGQVGRGLGVL